jgi:endonuclease YncB( thermonuclease family)
MSVDTRSLRGRAQRLCLACGVLFAALSGAAGAEQLIGIPARVFDGDSFVLQTDQREVEVRLGEIDAPEHGQPYADTARSALDGLIWGQRLRAVILDEDIYHRKVCRVYRISDGLDINAQLVRDGDVWVYRRRVRDLRLYDIEREARQAQRGLWGLPASDREPPWRWRREHPRPHQKVDKPVASISR